MSKPPKPTSAQRAALTLLAAGPAYRSLRAFADTSVYANGQRITPATVTALVRHGWATWAPEESLRRPLLLTDAGRAAVLALCELGDDETTATT